MAKEIYVQLKNMLLSKGHLVKEDCNIKPLEGERDIERKVEALTIFHKEAKGHKFNIEERIPNILGKNFEDAKVDLKRLKREMYNMRNKSNISPLEEILLIKGKEVIERGERSVGLVYDNGYISLIKRSMRNWEIVFGSKAIDLIDYDERLNIRTLNECNYDMVEWDYIDLIVKLKKRGVNFSIRDVLEHCVYMEGLEKNSLNFMLAMSDFPYDFLKSFNRYNENKHLWSAKDMQDKMERAILRDGKSILG